MDGDRQHEREDKDDDLSKAPSVFVFFLRLWPLYIEMSTWTTAAIMCNQWPKTDIIKFIMFFHNEAALTFGLSPTANRNIKAPRNLVDALSALWKQQCLPTSA